MRTIINDLEWDVLNIFEDFFSDVDFLIKVKRENEIEDTYEVYKEQIKECFKEYLRDYEDIL